MQHDAPDRESPGAARLFGRDAAVLLAMVLVAAAVATALHLHAAIPMPIAAAVALALHVLMFSTHVLLFMRPARPRRPVAMRRAGSEPQRRDIPKAQPMTRPAPAGPTAQSTAGTSDASVSHAAGQADADSLARDPELVAPAPGLPEARESRPPADAELIGALIRQLAESGGAPASDERGDGGPVVDGDRETAITASVQALRHAAEAMHEAIDGDRDAGVAAAPAATADHLPPTPDRLAQAPVKRAALAEIAEALQAERLEVAVMPVLGLSDRRAEHFEIVVRLLTRSGDVLVPSGIEQIAAGTGLLPLLETLKVGRAVRLGERLQAAGRPGMLLSRTTGEGLASDRLVRALISEAETPATRVVLSFSQTDVRAFKQAHWTTLADLADMGFRFALEEVVDLDMDFEMLRNVGFGFLKLDAGALIEGLPTRAGTLASADICRYLAQLGLVLVVGRIDDEQTLAQILSLGVPFGQGALIGAPKPVQIEPAAREAAA